MRATDSISGSASSQSGSGSSISAAKTSGGGGISAPSNAEASASSSGLACPLVGGIDESWPLTSVTDVFGGTCWLKLPPLGGGSEGGPVAPCESPLPARQALRPRAIACPIRQH